MKKFPDSILKPQLVLGSIKWQNTRHLKVGDTMELPDGATLRCLFKPKRKAK